MMITKDTNDAVFQIRSYSPGCIAVNDTAYHSSLIVTSKKLVTDWPPQSLTELTPENWEAVIRLSPEILLFGVGEHFKMPPASLLAPLYAKKIAVESMSTAAACRTYIALAAEGRSVAAALLIN
jgi:uncharacterized protein